jgi:hypothetical protein
MPGIGGNQPKTLLFSVDAEPDDELWQGIKAGPFRRENLNGIPELQRRLNALGVRATYLVSHSVAEHGGLETILKAELASGACEAGTHFHPGDTPPFIRQGPGSGDNILRLPGEVLEAKFAALHALIAARFGKPVSHRAGAWTLDARLTAQLVRHGYKVDSSVTPGVSWKRNDRPSYLGVPMRAYGLGSGDPCIPGDTGILEIPVSIWSPRRWNDTLAGTLFGDILTMPLAARAGAAVRLVRALRPAPPQWLRPAFMEAEEMIGVADRLEADGADYMHVMCHSNEVWPGASPYCRSRADLDRFYARLEGLLKALIARGYRPLTLGGYAAAVAPGGDTREKARTETGVGEASFKKAGP